MYVLISPSATVVGSGKTVYYITTTTFCDDDDSLTGPPVSYTYTRSGLFHSTIFLSVLWYGI